MVAAQLRRATTNMKNRILKCLVALPVCVVTTGPALGDTFTYSYQRVFDANADTYIVDQQYVKKFSEWQAQPVTYWGPSANDVASSLTMRFNFSAPTAQVSLGADLVAANWINGGRTDYGYSSLWASTDGASWQELASAQVATGVPFIGTNVVYQQDLPASLLGATELWLRVEMFTHDSLVNTYPAAASWADAQFSRYDPANPPATPTFELEVTTVPEPGAVVLLSLGGAMWVFGRRRL